MTTTTPSTAELRTWALAHDIKVADRGRISADVLDAWKAAHNTAGRSTGAAKPAPASAKPVSKVQRTAKQAAAPASAKASAATDAEQESRASKAEVLYEALEQRVRALEERVSDANSATATKKRGLFRRSS